MRGKLLLRNLRLERFLIRPESWKARYKDMPEECKRVVDTPMEKLDASYGIGLHPKIGWFILTTQGQGQGPVLRWKQGSYSEDLARIPEID